MRAKVLGVQPIHFTNNSGEPINGTNLFIAFSDENCKGLKADKVFVREEITLPKDLKLNEDVELSFNYKGKLESIIKVN